ncbi:hypothetical protein F4604DRAFT_1830078 [Suillus subluteus]|nr:hypothetical protein F4604DRAFT_1830078 [Suillus subluteus]
MTDIATPEFLKELQSLYPATAKYVDGDWFLAAAVAFSSSNCPEAVPRVLRYTLDDLDKLSVTSYEDRKLLVRKMRDGIFKSGMLSGCPKVHEPYSDSTRSNEEDAAVGQAYFNSTFGDSATKIQSVLRSIYPDLEHFTMSIGCGRHFATISAMIANATLSRLEWHLTRAVDYGATVEEVRAVREIALRIAIKAGVPLKIEVPNI